METIIVPSEHKLFQTSRQPNQYILHDLSFQVFPSFFNGTILILLKLIFFYVSVQNSRTNIFSGYFSLLFAFIFLVHFLSLYVYSILFSFVYP